jgi:hypothetical protein
VTSGIQSAGQSKHFQLTAEEEHNHLTGGLRALPGYFHSVRPSTNQLLLNANFSAAPFYRGIPLRQLVSDFDPGKWHFDKPHHAATLQRFLQGLRITVTYPNRDPFEETISELVLLGRVAARATDVLPATYGTSKAVRSL